MAEHSVNELNKSNKIYKSSPVFNHLLEKFKLHYPLRSSLSLDEGMIPTKKNSLSIKQYLKDQLIKWGIKTFLVCGSENGYISNAEVYTGCREDAETLENLVRTIVKSTEGFLWFAQKLSKVAMHTWVAPIKMTNLPNCIGADIITNGHVILFGSFLWAAYNAYVIVGHYKPHNPQGQRMFTFHTFVENLCHELVGNYYRLLPVKIHPNTNFYKITDHTRWKESPPPPAYATLSNRCVVCLGKHNRARQQNPSAAYKDLPKKSKTVYWCNYCKAFLCIGVPQQNCWHDYYAKVQFWR
uniref:PiggyBac transposable element-derived protein domain-containing protein n=1 Tax=Octopus bimaculoides TaxID=37653 RepID=A0A0L8GN61_OCTBM